MKPIKRIAILTIVVSGIVVFGLAPGMNKAGDVQYVRTYEDTFNLSENGEKATPDGKTESAAFRRAETDTSRRKSGKVYRQERIKRNATLPDIQPKMFSRAIQFVEEIDTLRRDSISFVQRTPVDTTREMH